MCMKNRCSTLLSPPSPPFHALPLPTPPLSSPGTLCDFKDECGDLYLAENDGLTYRFLARRLYLRYTEDVSTPVLHVYVHGVSVTSTTHCLDCQVLSSHALQDSCDMHSCFT